MKSQVFEPRCPNPVMLTTTALQALLNLWMAFATDYQLCWLKFFMRTQSSSSTATREFWICLKFKWNYRRHLKDVHWLLLDSTLAYTKWQFQTVCACWTAISSGPKANLPPLAYSPLTQNEPCQTQSDYHATQLTQVSVTYSLQPHNHITNAKIPTPSLFSLTLLTPPLTPLTNQH